MLFDAPSVFLLLPLMSKASWFSGLAFVLVGFGVWRKKKERGFVVLCFSVVWRRRALNKTDVQNLVLFCAQVFGLDPCDKP